MNTLHTLATGKWFFTHGFEAMIIIGLIFTTVGLLFGKRLWSHCSDESRRIDRLNETLRKRRSSIRENNEKLAAHLELLD